MARAWVLDTDTKGTGAQMVPLENVESGAPDGSELNAVRLAAPADGNAADRRMPSGPPRFRVVDVMTQEPLVDDADARAALEALAGVRSVVDVSVYARRPGDADWRRLSLPERRRLWSLRAGASVEAADR